MRPANHAAKLARGCLASYSNNCLPLPGACSQASGGAAPEDALEALKGFELPKVNRTGKLSMTKVECFEEKRNPYVTPRH